MKKIILILLAVLCSGCGKKLTCTYKENYEDVKIDNTIVFNFKDNTYEETDIMVFKNSEEASEYFQDIKDYIEEFNLVLNDNKIISVLSGNINNNKNAIKEKYESYDFTCK